MLENPGLLLDQLPEGIIIVNRAGEISGCNHAAGKILGHSSEQMIGQPIDLVVQLPGAEGGLLDQTGLGSGFFQVDVITCLGEEKTLSISCTDLPTNQRILVMRDVTEIESVQRLRSYFLANISHEFRTPLSALSASVELLLENIDTLPRDEIAHLLRSIQYSVTGLQTLIDNLLESTSIEAGHFQIRRQTTSLQKIVENSLEVIRPLFVRRQQRLEIKLPVQKITFQADPVRLAQVLVNLLSNASKYSPLDSQITLKAEIRPEQLLRVSIVDEGPGIAPHEQALLFRRFSRGGRVKGVHFGAGLGLSVVKAIIEAHGGRVGVENNPQKGACFWFELETGGAG